MNADILKGMIKIIDASAERGAFKGNELTFVATIRQAIMTEIEETGGDKDEETGQ